MSGANNESYHYCATGEVRSVFDTHVQHEGPERGGVLLGKIYPEDKRIVIVGATEPGAGDCGTASTWFRDATRANRLIEEAWIESEGLVNYVGEWHTHAEDEPRPSRRDATTMRSLSRRRPLASDGLILLIIGRGSISATYWAKGKMTEVSIEWVA